MKKHKANAVWKGSIKEGAGIMSTQSKVLNDTPYSFKTRFGDGKGANPDELIAASHAGCFAMALSLILGENGFTPGSLDVDAVITMDTEKVELTGSHLTLEAKIPDISLEKFLELAQAAKDGCPISKALNLPISLDATLV